MEIYGICAQPLYIFQADDELLELAQHLSVNIENWISGHVKLSQDMELHRKEEYKPLADWFHECLQKVKNKYEMPCERLKITECWTNRIERGGYHHIHKHRLSIVSGIFNVTKSISDTNFFLRDHFYCDNVQIGMEKNSRFRKNKEGFIRDNLPNKPGQLVLFPSPITHGVGLHNDDETRMTISFNSFYDGKCGHIHGQGFVNLTVN